MIAVIVGDNFAIGHNHTGTAMTRKKFVIANCIQCIVLHVLRLVYRCYRINHNRVSLQGP